MDPIIFIATGASLLAIVSAIIGVVSSTRSNTPKANARFLFKLDINGEEVEVEYDSDKDGNLKPEAISQIVKRLKSIGRDNSRVAFSDSFASLSVRALIHGKVSEKYIKDGQSVYRYIIVASRKLKDGNWGKAEEFELNQLDYAQMHENTEVDLFFNEENKYECFRLVKSNIPSNHQPY